MTEENITSTAKPPEGQTPRQQKRLQNLDVVIALLAGGLSVFLYAYYAGFQEQPFVLIFATLFIIISLYYARKAITATISPVINLVVDNSAITAVIMLNEQGNIMNQWEIKGKTSLLIGKHTKNKEVDIDLSDSSYEALIYNEHAVMNFAAGKWYLERVHKESSISIQKVSDRMRYRLTGAKPCQLEPGDVVYIASTRLLMK